MARPRVPGFPDQISCAFSLDARLLGASFVVDVSAMHRPAAVSADWPRSRLALQARFAAGGIVAMPAAPRA